MTRPALIVGGQGFFGREVVDDLLAHSPGHLVVAGRRRRFEYRNPRVTWRTFDLERPSDVRDFGVVVCCAGPYQKMSTALVEAAARAGVPYIDLAEEGEFIERARRVKSPAPILSGLSVVPGLTCLLAARAGVGRATAIRTIVAPGSRPQRGDATVSALLSGIDRWDQREILRLPAPVGRRVAYRTHPFGDPDLVAELFDGARFEFKLAPDLDFFCRSLEIVSRLRRLGWMPNPRLLGPAVRALSLLGTDAGAARVEMEGTSGRYEGTVVARNRGHRIPAILAAIAAARILAGRLTGTRLDRWLPDLEPELKLRDLRLIERRSP